MKLIYVCLFICNPLTILRKGLKTAAVVHHSLGQSSAIELEKF
jgi:hypothetical protein